MPVRHLWQASGRQLLRRRRLYMRRVLFHRPPKSRFPIIACEGTGKRGLTEQHANGQLVETFGFRRKTFDALRCLPVAPCIAPRRELTVPKAPRRGRDRESSHAYAPQEVHQCERAAREKAGFTFDDDGPVA